MPFYKCIRLFQACLEHWQVANNLNNKFRAAEPIVSHLDRRISAATHSRYYIKH